MGIRSRWWRGWAGWVEGLSGGGKVLDAVAGVC
jgi:hypothetical protein